MNSAIAAKLATLIVYAYSSFTSTFGAGPIIVKNFEEICECKVLLIDAGDAGSMLSKVKLEGKKTKADVLIGVDGAFLWRLKKDLGWNSTPELFDRSPLAFIYNSEIVSEPPKSLDDLLKPEWKKQIVIEDPRLSTVGLNFLLWVIGEKGEDKAWDYFAQLKGQIKTVTPSWDLAYGLFKKNRVKLVLSYWTSPAYHIQEEKTEIFKAAVFNKGHFVQNEYVAENPYSQNRVLADRFIKYLLSEKAQEIIPEKNFMYPANKKSPLTPAFKKLGEAPSMKNFDDDTLKLNLEKWLAKWRDIFS